MKTGKFWKLARIVSVVVLPATVSFNSPAVYARGLVAQTIPAPATNAATKASALAGAWSLNRELSDRSPNGGGREGEGGARGEGSGRGGRRGGFGGGGRGGGFSGAPGGDPQQAERKREAMRDLMNPPEHLTIVSTESMVILTGPDGRTIRLSPDGKKVKDDNTNIERKTKWDGEKLVSEISGLPGARITETYVIDAEHAQLRVTAAVDSGSGGPARTITHVYDRDVR